MRQGTTMKTRRITTMKTKSKTGSIGERILGSMMQRLPGILSPRPGFLSFRKVRLSAFSLALVLGSVGTVGVAFDASPVMAQRPGVLRTVSGKVTDKGDKPLRGSVVYLKDDKSL